MRERAAAERTAAAEERTRIARELHDVIGHQVTVIALQADAAAAALAVAPGRAAVPVAAIRASAAQALTEMRRVVGLLRDTGDDDADLHPQPGLADLPELVERARAAGNDVALGLAPPTAPLPPSLQLAVYRIVQEALTNAARHAPGSAVRVSVAATPACLRVSVQNTASRGNGSASRGGHGLVGIRVRMHGGRLEAGPASAGFGVTAELPLALHPVP